MTKQEAIREGLRVFEPVACTKCGWLMDPADDRTIWLPEDNGSHPYCQDCVEVKVLDEAEL